VPLPAAAALSTSACLLAIYPLLAPSPLCPLPCPQGRLCSQSIGECGSTLVITPLPSRALCTGIGSVDRRIGISLPYPLRRYRRWLPSLYSPCADGCNAAHTILIPHGSSSDRLRHGPARQKAKVACHCCSSWALSSLFSPPSLLSLVLSSVPSPSSLSPLLLPSSSLSSLPALSSPSLLLLSSSLLPELAPQQEDPFYAFFYFTACRSFSSFTAASCSLQPS
jgi:hypothetical protein